MKRVYGIKVCGIRQIMLLYFLIPLYLIPYTSFAQQSKIDSLLSLLRTPNSQLPDTSKVNTLNDLAWEYKYTNPDTSYIILKQALALAEKKKYNKGEANALCGIGGYNLDKANYPQALNFYFSSLKISESINDKPGIARTLGNIGLVYYSQADYPRALDYYFKALKTFEELGDKNRIAAVLGNIGSVYADIVRSRESGVGSKTNMPDSLSELQTPNSELLKKALDYYFKALKLGEELGDKNRIAIQLGNIGIVYHSQAAASSEAKAKEELFNRAIDYYFKALKMKEELGNKSGIAINLGNIGSLYTKTGKFGEAEKYLKHSLALADSIGALSYTREFEQSLSHLYDTLSQLAVGSGQLAKKAEYSNLAFIHYKKYIAARDTIANDENTKKQTRTEMNYEFEKKEAKAKAEVEVKEAVAAAEKQRQRIVLILVSCVLLLVLVFAGFIFRALRITQKQKRLIEQQKKMVEEKQAEILASIRYAKRIQDAILPTEKYIHKTFERLRAKMP